MLVCSYARMMCVLAPDSSLSPSSTTGAQNRVGGMFFVLAFFGFTSLTTIDLLMSERRLVAR